MADDAKVNAFFMILESNDYNDYPYSAEDINMLEKRRMRYLNGEGKNFTVEESFTDIRKEIKYHMLFSLEMMRMRIWLSQIYIIRKLSKF